MASDTLTRDRPVILRPWQVRALGEGRLRRILVPVMPEPKWKYQGNYLRGGVAAVARGRHVITVGFGMACETFVLEECPLGVEGTRLWVRETWWQGHGVVHGDNMSMYDADVTDYVDRDEWVKRPARTMPREASRYTLINRGPQVMQLGQVTSKVAAECGAKFKVAFDLEGTQPAASGYLAEFHRQWNSDHPRQPWTPERWAWSVAVELEGGA